MTYSCKCFSCKKIFMSLKIETVCTRCRDVISLSKVVCKKSELISHPAKGENLFAHRRLLLDN